LTTFAAGAGAAARTGFGFGLGAAATRLTLGLTLAWTLALRRAGAAFRAFDFGRGLTLFLAVFFAIFFAGRLAARVRAAGRDALPAELGFRFPRFASFLAIDV
jgi:hypothetical protein